MFDLHAHILPGLDDGPREWDMAVAMLRMAAGDGIKGIVATPHVSFVYDNRAETVLTLTVELGRRAGDVRVDIYPGSELAVTKESLAGILQKRYCTLNQSRYVLIELPQYFTSHPVMEFIFSLTSAGLVPIVAHPERNPMVQSSLDSLNEMVRLGALVQVTAGSLLGHFGDGAKKLAREMLARRLAHVIASDAHNDGLRAPLLSGGLREAIKIVGEAEAKAMVSGVPEKIIKDQPFDAAEPVHVRKRNFFF